MTEVLVVALWDPSSAIATTKMSLAAFGRSGTSASKVPSLALTANTTSGADTSTEEALGANPVNVTVGSLVVFGCGSRVGDPLAALVYGFAQSVMEVARERVRTESLAIQDRARLYRQIIETLDYYLET